MERIVNAGYSGLLLELTKRVGNVTKKERGNEAVSENVVAMTQIGKEFDEVERKDVGHALAVETFQESQGKMKADQEESTKVMDPAEDKALIRYKMDWDSIDKRVCVVEVGDYSCNEEDLRVLDFRGFVNLREFRVGNRCFMYTDDVKLIGLKELERVVIGVGCFTKDINGQDPNRHFCLKNCPKLKSLRIGCYSFTDYTLCVIDNVDALETIEMGELNEESRNFWHDSSLELESA